MDQTNIAGFNFSQLTLQETIDQIERWAADDQVRGKCLAIVNPHSVETAHRDPEFAEAIRAADIVTPDGVGIVLASRILGAGIPEQVHGPDIFEQLCRQLNGKKAGTKMFFLGSTTENLKAIERKFSADFPNLEVVGTYSPPYKPRFSEEDLSRMIQIVNQSGADILWIGLGAPKQEKWAQACRDRLNVKVIAPVGGVFDFYTERVKLPPKWVQKMGLIFLVRFLQEPKRLWRRNLDSPVFLARVIRQRIREGRLRAED